MPKEIEAKDKRFRIVATKCCFLVVFAILKIVMCSFILSSTISWYFIIVVNTIPVPFQNGVKYVVECHMIYYQKRKSTRKISI